MPNAPESGLESGLESGPDPSADFTLIERELLTAVRTAHPYTIHHTYTGPGCAICGHPIHHPRHFLK
jgi:hypothetical protein